MITFYASIADEITGAILIEELECEIEVYRTNRNEFTIEDVRVDGSSLYRGTILSHLIAAQVEEQAYADDDFVQEALSDE